MRRLNSGPAIGASSALNHSALATEGPSHRLNACSSATWPQSGKVLLARGSVKT